MRVWDAPRAIVSPRRVLMPKSHFPSGGLAPHSKRHTTFRAMTALVAVAGVALAAGLSARHGLPNAMPASPTVERAPVERGTFAIPGDYAWALDPTPALKPEVLAFARNVPLVSTFQSS